MYTFIHLFREISYVRKGYMILIYGGWGVSGIVEYSEKQRMQWLKAWALELDRLGLCVDSYHLPAGRKSCLTFLWLFLPFAKSIETQFLSQGCFGEWSNTYKVPGLVLGQHIAVAQQALAITLLLPLFCYCYSWWETKEVRNLSWSLRTHGNRSSPGPPGG